jgi:hypothetical protein
MAQATPQSTSEAPGSWNAITLTELLDVYSANGGRVRNIPDGATLSFNANAGGVGVPGWVVSNSV